MSAPIIGLTTHNSKNECGNPIAALNHKYIRAVTEAGGAAVLIPSGITDEQRVSLLEKLDGFLLTGGGDVGIERFNGESHPSVNDIDPDRDALELAILRALAENGKPFLGVCRGVQVINVALGGTLFTHIQDQLPGAIKHDYDSCTQREFLAHEVHLKENSILAGILSETKLKVNSLHHQGVMNLASSLNPVAYAPDGLVEAVEFPGSSFGIGVQWHPEWLTDQPAAQRLFRAFIEAAERV